MELGGNNRKKARIYTVVRLKNSSRRPLYQGLRIFRLKKPFLQRLEDKFTRCALLMQPSRIDAARQLHFSKNADFCGGFYPAAGYQPSI